MRSAPFLLYTCVAFWGLSSDAVQRHKNVLYLCCQGNYDQYMKTREELEENQMKRFNWEQDQITHMKVGGAPRLVGAMYCTSYYLLQLLSN